MVINMSQIPIAPIGRIIKNAGNARVSEDAKETLAKVLEEYAENIAKQAILLTKHAGRVTVKVSDIELAVKELK